MLASLGVGAIVNAEKIQEPLALHRFSRAERPQERGSSHGQEGVQEHFSARSRSTPVKKSSFSEMLKTSRRRNAKKKNTTKESSGCTEWRAGANRFRFGCDSAVHGEPYDENETRGSGGDQAAWRNNDEARRI